MKNLLRSLVGVIDLKSGRAVRAAGGDRNQYQNVNLFRHCDGSTTSLHGAAERLVNCYQQEKILQFYIADLDGIATGKIQRAMMESLLWKLTPSPVLLDVGLKRSGWFNENQWLVRLIRSNPSLKLAIPTECGATPDLIQTATGQVPATQLAISFDYRGGDWISPTTSEDEWIRAGNQFNIPTAIALDLAVVGSGDVSPTARMCKRLRDRLPHVKLISGGGIVSAEDAQMLLDCGADQLLVASLFVS